MTEQFAYGIGHFKMSKVTFRARALDASRPMPVFKAEDIPDLPDFATINRSVPQMPTGMEKEEETVRPFVNKFVQKWPPSCDVAGF